MELMILLVNVAQDSGNYAKMSSFNFNDYEYVKDVHPSESYVEFSFILIGGNSVDIKKYQSKIKIIYILKYVNYNKINITITYILIGCNSIDIK